MSLSSGTELLSGATALGQRCVPSFDVAGGNIDMLHALCSQLAGHGAAAFLASTPASIHSYHGMAHFLSTVREVAARYDVQVAAHLDHATELEAIKEALDAGCRSVMVDGSALPREENIALTRAAVALARNNAASVEAEIGVIGGKAASADGSCLPSLEDARSFAECTGIDLLAPAIGTVHGIVARPCIEWTLAQRLAAEVRLPLVLHGATGLAEDTLRGLVDIGFRKANFATGVRGAFLEGVRSEISREPNARPQAFLRSGRAAVERFAGKVLELLS